MKEAIVLLPLVMVALGFVLYPLVPIGFAVTWAFWWLLAMVGGLLGWWIGR